MKLYFLLQTEIEDDDDLLVSDLQQLLKRVAAAELAAGQHITLERTQPVLDLPSKLREYCADIPCQDADLRKVSALVVSLAQELRKREAVATHIELIDARKNVKNRYSLVHKEKTVPPVIHFKIVVPPEHAGTANEVTNPHALLRGKYRRNLDFKQYVQSTCRLTFSEDKHVSVVKRADVLEVAITIDDVTLLESYYRAIDELCSQECNPVELELIDVQYEITKSVQSFSLEGGEQEPLQQQVRRRLSFNFSDDATQSQSEPELKLNI